MTKVAPLGSRKGREEMEKENKEEEEEEREEMQQQAFIVPAPAGVVRAFSSSPAVSSVDIFQIG